MARLARQLVTIVIAGGAVGLVLNAMSPRPVVLGRPVFPPLGSEEGTCSAPAGSEPTQFPRMPLEEALVACSACSAAFVDARSAAAFARGHVAGAIHLPPGDDAELRHALERLRSFDTIVVYDDVAGCRLGQGVAERLAREGFGDVRVLEGTWRDWEAAQGPAQAGACEACGAGESGG